MVYKHLGSLSISISVTEIGELAEMIDDDIDNLAISRTHQSQQAHRVVVSSLDMHLILKDGTFISLFERAVSSSVHKLIIVPSYLKL